MYDFYLSLFLPSRIWGKMLILWGSETVLTHEIHKISSLCPSPRPSANPCRRRFEIVFWHPSHATELLSLTLSHCLYCITVFLPQETFFCVFSFLSLISLYQLSSFLRLLTSSFSFFFLLLLYFAPLSLSLSSILSRITASPSQAIPKYKSKAQTNNQDNHNRTNNPHWHNQRR